MSHHHHQTPRIVGLGVLLLMLPALALAADTDDAYEAEIDAWYAARVERLTAPDGWLTLIGLFWLQEGPNTMGSGASSQILLPADKAPGHVATLEKSGGRVELVAAPGADLSRDGRAVTRMTMLPDTSGEPTILDIGDLQFFVIERGDRLGLRVRDRQSPRRFDFPGIERFPVDPRWRIEGTLERHDPPQTIPIPNVLGTVAQEPSPGTLVFDFDGHTYRIDALPASDDRLYLIFADATSGRETYGGGRFLYSDPVQPDGSVVADFNKAYNPPCAFTDFATCPLPPRQNKLAVRIEAGEKKYGDH